MRRLILAATALILVPALAYAGVTATQGKNTLKIKTTFDPAQASKSKNRLRPIKVKYDYWAGTTNDTRLADLRSVKVFLGGAKFGFRAFPQCELSEALAKGESACPDGSRVGKGTAIAEVHPPDSQTSRQDVPVEVRLYNAVIDTDAEDRPIDPPRPGLVIVTKVGDQNIAFPFEGERRARQLAYYNPEEDAAGDSLYSVKEIHVTIARRSVMRSGRRVPYVGAPVKCDRRWTVTTTNEPYQGQPLTAKHRVRCTKA